MVEQNGLPSGNLTQPWKITIEIVDFPIKNSDFPQLFVCLPEGNGWLNPWFYPEMEAMKTTNFLWVEVTNGLVINMEIHRMIW